MAIGVVPQSNGTESDDDVLLTSGDSTFQLKAEADTNAASAMSDQSDLKYPRAYLRRAAAKMAFKNYQGALSDISKAIELDPTFVAAYSERALAEHRLGYEDDAYADSSVAIRLNPKYASAYNVRGIVEMDFNPDYKSAMADFNKAIELAPRFHAAYNNRAWVKRRLKDYDGALQDIDQSIKSAPGQVWAYAFRGCMRNDLQQFEAALEDFRQAVKLDPSAEFCQIRIWLIRMRLNEQNEATRELVGHVKSLPRAYLSRWPVPVEGFLTGTTVEDDVLQASKIPVTNTRTQLEHLCDANYFIGMKHLLAGDKTGAANYLQKAVNAILVGYSSYESAAAELNLLESQ